MKGGKSETEYSTVYDSDLAWSAVECGLENVGHSREFCILAEQTNFDALICNI